MIASTIKNVCLMKIARLLAFWALANVKKTEVCEKRREILRELSWRLTSESTLTPKIIENQNFMSEIGIKE
jgi:hypothetical protein